MGEEFWGLGVELERLKMVADSGELHKEIDLF